MNVKQLFFENATPRARDHNIVGHEFGNHEADEVESPDLIVDRLPGALQVWLSGKNILIPDCGFGCSANRCVNAEPDFNKLQ